jgi:hypothetical protein
MTGMSLTGVIRTATLALHGASARTTDPGGERPIFGKVRYMNANGLKWKFDVEGYVRRIAALTTVNRASETRRIRVQSDFGTGVREDHPSKTHIFLIAPSTCSILSVLQ